MTVHKEPRRISGRPPEIAIPFENILTSGCSFTFNNSAEHICTWPFFLRDLASSNVLDCSQSGAGTNHIFNSIINEIENNPKITPENTLVIVMWSGLSRTDVIAPREITKDWHFMSNYNFNSTHSTFSIFNHIDDSSNDDISKLCRMYKKIVGIDSQIYESCIKIVALEAYLNAKGFKFVFTEYQDISSEFSIINEPIASAASNAIAKLTSVGEYSTAINELEPDGHPLPEGHLLWTRHCLMPYLIKNGMASAV